MVVEEQLADLVDQVEAVERDVMLQAQATLLQQLLLKEIMVGLEVQLLQTFQMAAVEVYQV